MQNLVFTINMLLRTVQINQNNNFMNFKKPKLIKLKSTDQWDLDLTFELYSLKFHKVLY